MHRRTTAVSFASVLCLAAIGLTPVVANAETAPTNAISSELDIDPSVLAARYYAGENSVSVARATTAIADQFVLAEAIRTLDVELGVDADIWVEQDGGEQVIFVRTTDSALGDSLAKMNLSEDATVDVILEAPLAEQAVALTRADGSVVRKYSPGVQGQYVRASDGALVIDTTDSLTKAAIDKIASETGFATVVVEETEPVGDTITIRGGAGLGNCTAGFSATYGTYVGYISAAHCGSSTTLYANTAGTGTSAAGTNRIQIHNANADIAFYSVASTNTRSASFFGSSATTATTVGNPQDMPAGVSVCRRGKTSGWGCGNIASIAYQPTYANACLTATCSAVFVKVDLGTLGGDSGGPWVNGNSPIGINKGGSTSFSIYSKIYRVPAGVAYGPS